MSEQEKQVWHEELINYLCNPFDFRNYEEFAKSIGLTYQTIYRYRRAHEQEIALEVKRRKDAMFDSMRSVAYKSLASKLKTDTNALKLFFQLAGDLIERTEVKTEILTVDQKREKVRSLLESIQLPANGSRITQDGRLALPAPVAPNDGSAGLAGHPSSVSQDKV